MDLDDILDDVKYDNKAKVKVDNTHHFEIEDERSNGNREVYINKALIFSNRYIDAIKSLNENRYCTKRIIDSSREMLLHHHGDKYEDLYFIDSQTYKVLARTDYRWNEQEVLPTTAMKEMARNNPNIISIHNHPTDALPSYEDVKTCYLVGYKYGLVVCHGGDIFQYSTIGDLNKVVYDSEIKRYYKKERKLSDDYLIGKISETDFKNIHNVNFINLSAKLLDAGVLIKEVLWNEKPQRYGNEGNDFKKTWN